MKIADGIYESKNPIGSHLFSINCFLLTDGRDSYLFDTGWSKELANKVIGVEPEREGWPVLMEMFDEAGVDIKRLKGIIVSHYHPDHAGYVDDLIALTGAPVYTTEIELAENLLLADRSKQWEIENRHWYHINGVPEDETELMIWASPHYTDAPRSKARLVQDGDVFSIGDMNWEVIWTPGHSWGHICLWERKRNIVLTGDHVLGHDTPIIMSRPCLDKLRTNPLGGYLWSLHRLEQCANALALPSHADPVENLPERLEWLLHHHDQRYTDIYETLADGEMCAFDIACSIPWMGRRKKLMDMPRLLDRWLAFTETVAHLRSLEDRELIELVRRDGKCFWKRTGATIMRYDGTDPRLKPLRSLSDII